MMTDGELDDGSEMEGVAGEGLTQCPSCGKEFKKQRSWAVFCGDPCRFRYLQLERKEALNEYRAMKKARGVEDAE